jgi:hypothetical protein
VEGQRQRVSDSNRGIDRQREGGRWREAHSARSIVE